MSLATKITIVPISEVPNLRPDSAGKDSATSVQLNVAPSAPPLAASDVQSVSKRNGRFRIKAGMKTPARKAKRNSIRKRIY